MQEQPTSHDEFLTVAEVAALLKIPKERVYRLCSAGTIRSLSLGAGTRRIRRVDLDAYLEDLAA